MNKLWLYSFVLLFLVSACKKEDPLPTPIQTSNSSDNNSNNIFSVINQTNSPLTSNNIKAIFASQNKLYFASTNELVSYYNNQWVVSRFSKSSYINMLNCIAGNDSLLFAGTNNGVYKIKGADTLLINLLGIPTNNIRSLCLHDSILWIGIISGGGLVKYNILANKISATYNSSNSNLPNASIGKITADGQNIWIATSSGFLFFDGTSFINYNKSNSDLPNNSVYDICVNGYQDIWIAHNGGISYFLNGTFTNYDMNNSGLSLNLTRCILKYNNTIYIGTYGQGLDVFDLNKTSFSHFNINNSNLSNNFLSGFCVFENKLYVGTENGINAISL
jgi:hypothetical protein